MYELEIQTKSGLRKKIRNPKEARDKRRMCRYIIQVMDERGKWHYIGECSYIMHASWAIQAINKSINAQKPSLYLHYIE